MSTSAISVSQQDAQVTVVTAINLELIHLKLIRLLGCRLRQTSARGRSAPPPDYRNARWLPFHHFLLRSAHSMGLPHTTHFAEFAPHCRLRHCVETPNTAQ